MVIALDPETVDYGRARQIAAHSIRASGLVGRAGRSCHVTTGEDAMSPSRSTRKSPVAWVVASILLLAAVFAAFWVPIYARKAPKLGDFPFFYWFQLILVPAVAIVSWLAYLLVRRAPGPAAVAAVATGARPEPGEPPAAPAAADDAPTGPEAAV
jgi:Protein of unknown function (DUF3311)